MQLIAKLGVQSVNTKLSHFMELMARGIIIMLMQ